MFLTNWFSWFGCTWSWSYKPITLKAIKSRFFAEIRKSDDMKILSLNYFMLFAFNVLNWYSKPSVAKCAIKNCQSLFFFHWRKKIVTDTCRNEIKVCFAEIAICQNYPNTTRRYAVLGMIVDNFEISVAVLSPNITTSHAITYTYTLPFTSDKLTDDDSTCNRRVFWESKSWMGMWFPLTQDYNMNIS